MVKRLKTVYLILAPPVPQSASTHARMSHVPQQAGVIGHPAIEKRLPSRPSDFFLQATRKVTVDAILMMQRAASTAPCDNVIDRTEELNTRLSKHGDSNARHGANITPMILRIDHRKPSKAPAKLTPVMSHLSLPLRPSNQYF